MNPDPPQPRHDSSLLLWSRLSRDVAMVLWPSFLASCVASVFFFAIFDPVEITQGTPLADWFSVAHAGYAIGFFSFWAFTTLSSALTLYLARTERDITALAPTDSRPNEPHHE